METLTRRLCAAALCIAALALPARHAAAETRLALVIGNGGYQTAPLPNAPNDARLISAALSDAGFQVATVIDADQRALKGAVRAFVQRLKTAGQDTAAAFFYAGHGMQINGRNYLIPVNTPLRSASDVEYETVEAQWILDEIGESGAPLSIILLDACRNNPFPSISRGAPGGLARMDAPRGSILSYSTAPGDVALDGKGGNSPYSRALARAMRLPGLKIEDAFKQVRRSVLAETDDRQVPWESSSLVGDFYFSGGAAAVPRPPAPPAPPAAEIFRDCPDCPEMVALRGGAYRIGSDPSEPGREAVEGPAMSVSVAPFALARTEVTRGDFARFLAETGRTIAPGCWVWAAIWLHDPARSWNKPGYAQTDAHPAVCVPWADAAAYAEWMSARTGHRYRLPSEAEWEYAAGGDGGPPWGDDAASACRHDNLHDATGFAANGNALLTHFACADGAAATSPVGAYAANRLGLADMLGNVSEWTVDCWADSHRGRPGSGAARTTGDCGWRTFKGGNWNTYVSAFRPAYRWPGLQASSGSIYAGFRLARDLR